MSITNRGNIPLGLAVWLLHDEYDYIDEPSYVSATRLMKPLRHILLPPRVPRELRSSDVEDYVGRALGHSLHDSIESAWLKGYRRSLKLLGHPEHVIDRVLVNPTPDQLEKMPDAIPVYLEQRAFRKITVNGETFTIGGKFDMVTDGIVNDNKSTTAYTWLFGGKDDDYKLQGSLYNWINQKGHSYHNIECTDPLLVQRITEDFIRINFIFTDWQKMQARSNPKYPQSRLLSKDISLMTLEETERWIAAKLTQVQRYRNTPESQLPECTDEELWRSAPAYKYYSDPANTGGKSTKNFEDPAEARAHCASKGKGIVIAVPGEVKRCNFCDAFPICSQKDRYFQ